MDGGTNWEKRITNSESINPNFEEDGGELPKEYWEDWMRVLNDQNRDRLSKVDDDFMNFLTLESVEYIFTVCVRMRLPGEIRYLAALYFDKFMRIQTRRLFEFISSSAIPGNKKDEEWQKIESNVSRQVPLRVCSCIQLASKEFQYHTSLSTKEVVSMLRTLGHAYTYKAVYKSEIRIVRTLQFSLPSSPTVYPESLLKVIAAYPPERLGLECKLKIHNCWDHILLFLDMFFLYNEQFTTILLKTSKPTIPINSFEPATLAKVKSDYFLLGAGLVAASVTIVHNCAYAEKILSALEKHSKIPEKHIAEVCVSFIKLVEINKENTSSSQLE